MDKIRYVKWGNWIAPFGVLLSLLAVISAQPGFLSISCGGKTNHTAENNIRWVTDADYINVGQTEDTGDASASGSYFHTLRYFPLPLKKSCYKLPVTPDVPHLLRLWFVIGVYNGFGNSPSFQFSIETLGMLHVRNVTTIDRESVYYSRILVSSGTVLYICLIRTSERDDPFISAIELRTLQDGMYAQAKPGTMLLTAFYDVGGNSTIRYPQDQFDRIWTSTDSSLISSSYSKDVIRPVTSHAAISTRNTKDLPPTAVMQTAWVGNSLNIIPISVASTDRGTKSLLLLYFAEIEALNMSESRSFFVAVNGEEQSETITVVRNYTAIERAFLPNQVRYYFNVMMAEHSTRPPILNAFEYHWLSDTDQATYSQDIYAINALKRSFDIKDWISDPCYLIEWEGIGCDNSSSHIRISKLYLSRRNLTGLVPKDIAMLTALVNVSLDNNHLMGSLPNLSNLTMLERLYLQNNNLNGTVPEWLSELKNLKELNIANNNFSGVIPAEILLNCSLKLNYSGNLYLRMEKRKCTLQNSNNPNLRVVLGITLGGILIIASVLIVGVVVYRNKFRRKEEGLVTESSRVE